MAAVIMAFIAAAFCIRRTKASPTGDPRSCVEIEVPISVDTTAIKWLQPRVDSTIDAVDWVNYQTTWTSPNSTQSMIGTITVKQTVKINGQLCVPPKGNDKSDILQIVTHGGGFDKRYWDSEVKPKEYSYVNAALAEGYSIFTYDRLGTGRSSKPDAYTTVQIPLQVEILRQLTLLARNGTLLSSSKLFTPHPAITSYKAPSKIVHVGHSLGSIITMGLITNHPTLSSGVVATGFLYTNIPLPGLNLGTWGFEYAHEHNPRLFPDHGSGYLVSATPSNVQLNFLKKGSFEPTLLDYAYKIRQPIAVSEFKSLTSGFGTEGAKFEGPLHFVVGEGDYGVCGGDCKGSYDLAVIKGVIHPKAKEVGVLVQPGTGHGLTLSKNATAGWKVSFDFLGRNGL